jgi:hypothetical protein
MDHFTLEALKGSIAKWEGIAAGTIGDKGTDNCPLCQEFYRHGCRGCPIRENTGYSECTGSPYEEWLNVRPWRYDGKAETPEHKAAALNMVAYLKSLLPDNLEK